MTRGIVLRLGKLFFRARDLFVDARDLFEHVREHFVRASRTGLFPVPCRIGVDWFVRQIDGKPCVP